MSTLGKKMSEETKEKIRRANLGSNSPLFGTKQSDEHKRKRSKSQAKYPGINRFDRYLLARYNLSELNYCALFKSQDGKCKICGKPETVKHRGQVRRLSVDHDHTTGKVRGLLCDRCNRGIGIFNEDADLLIKAKTYLDSFK